MKKEFLKKVMALGLAGAMMLGMSTTVFADPATPVTTFDVPITQTIYFKNADAVQVYEPTIEYTYTIAPGAAGATITDDAGVTVKAKAGDMRAFGQAAATTAKTDIKIKYDKAHAVVTASADGKVAVTKKVTVQFDGSKITTDDVVTPGVYRYILTQNTTTDDKKAVGVEEVGTQDKTLVLDVTVRNDGTVAGAVIQDPTERTTDNPDVINENKGNKNGKTEGFGDPEVVPGSTDKETIPGSEDPGTQTSKVSTRTSDLPAYYDLYTTYNLTINKTVAGAMGDKSHKFPFSTAIANSVSGAKFTVSVAGGTATNPVVSSDAITGSLKHGEDIVITGLPKNLSASGDLTATTTETNDTADTYKVEAIFNSISDPKAFAQADVAANGTAATSAMVLTNETASGNTINKVVFTNTLNEISPTGVALRFAPYLLILAGAFFLVAFTRRRRVEE